MTMFIVLLLLACFHGLSAIQWISAYDNTTRTCSGCNLTLGWDYRLEPGETVNDIKWLFASDSGHTPSLMASYISGYFHSVPLYSNRLTHLGDGKVVLSGVTTADAGTYVIEVISKQTTGVSTIRRDLVVTVTDPSVYSHNVLSAKMDDQAVADDDGNLHVRLTCGPIAWRGEPPVDVVWTTPSDAKLNSTGYKNDYFYLILDNSVVTGVYACVLPASAIPALCLRAGDPMTRQATVTVDSTSAKHALFEANLQQLKGENFNLRQQLEDLTHQLKDVKKDNINLTQQLQQVRTKQDQCRVEVGNNTRRMKLLEDDFSQYRNISSTHVGFHARLGRDLVINDGEPLKFLFIFYNDGGAYDSTTGWFTAPVDGTYFFIFTTSPEGSGMFSSCTLVVGSGTTRFVGDSRAGIWSKYNDYYNYATGHAVLYVEKGTAVQVISLENGCFFDDWSSFSGFLIRADV